MDAFSDIQPSIDFSYLESAMMNQIIAEGFGGDEFDDIVTNGSSDSKQIPPRSFQVMVPALEMPIIINWDGNLADTM